jgi:hypothetical protein
MAAGERKGLQPACESNAFLFVRSKHDLAQHVPLGEALVGLCRVRQRETRRDWNL